MRSGKTFTIDIDLMLKKPTSDLVNRLLREHYGQDLSECTHSWSNAFATAEGLVKECVYCKKQEAIKIKEEEKP